MLYKQKITRNIVVIYLQGFDQTFDLNLNLKSNFHYFGKRKLHQSNIDSNVFKLLKKLRCC